MLIANKKSIYWLQSILAKGFIGVLGNSVPSRKEPLIVSQNKDVSYAAKGITVLNQAPQSAHFMG